MVSDGYKYDVFLSYRRLKETSFWIRKVRGQLALWLSEELGRQAEIFVDEDCIDLGSPWPDSLRAALQLSKCQVGVWSAMYFQSSWCMSEWQSFREREKILNGQIPLIAPLRFSDGQHFPDEAKLTEYHDVGAYAYTQEVFWKTEQALLLEHSLKAFSKKVAKIVTDAPSFEEWPVIQAPDLLPRKIELAKL